MRNMQSVLNNRPYLPLIVLAVATFAIFWPALGHDFLANWDDNRYVVENPIIQGVTFDHLIAAFTTSLMGNYAPLHLISYMLDFQLWGLRPSGFILTNIVLHTANGLLFYLLLRRLSGGKAWGFLAALVFLLHPVQVESVVWVSQRKNLLAMCFFLIAFHCYALYRDGEEGHGKKYYLCSLAAFALALLSKSVTVILPAVLVVFDLCFLKRRDVKRVLIDKIPFIVIAAIFSLVAIESHSVQSLGGETSYHGGSPYATLLTMLPVLARYLRMVVWPAQLSAYYDPPIKTAVDPEVAWAGALCLVLAAAGWMLYRRRRDLFFWFALFFIGLIPVSQIVPIVTLMNDRYLYFPMLGGAALLGWALVRDAKWPEVLNSRAIIPLSICSLVVVGGYAAVTASRIGVWQNSYTLWRDAVAKAPNSHVAHDGYGEGLMLRGDIDEAISQFTTALNLEPKGAARDLTPGERDALANTHNNLGTAYGMKGMTDDAIEQFTVALRLNPDFAKAYFNLGNALMHKGAIVEALRCFETAVRLSPGNPAFIANLRLTRELVGSGGARKAAGGTD